MSRTAARRWRPSATSAFSAAAAVGRRFAVCSGALAVILAVLGAPAQAQDKPATAAARTFMGTKVNPLKGTYLVVRDVNVRAKPKTGSKRLGRLARTARVEAVGKPKDAAWIAVRKDGKDLGFVYVPMLMPVIDGRLKKPIADRATGGDAACGYTIRFDGMGVIEDEVFGTFDYVIAFKCMVKGKQTDFIALMIITEGPLKVTRRPVYQLAIDVREPGEAFESAFSTIFTYQPDKGRVVFDSLSIGELGNPPAKKEMPAKSVPEALSRAIEMALATWNAKMWEALAKAAE